MIITLVMDQYGLVNNGTTATAMRFAEILRQHGHTVRIVTCVEGVREENVYVVPKRNIPIAMKIVRSHGMELAKPDKAVLINAIRGADVVHFFMPFKLAVAGKEVADALNVPSTAAFHVQPENIAFNVGLGRVRILLKSLYNRYKKFYDRFNRVHVPSRLMKDILLEYGYKSDIHVISNGVTNHFVHRDVERPDSLRGKFLVIMSARFGAEKRQDLLIEGIAHSKYADKIQLILCGKGPQQKKLEKLSKKSLVNPAIFKFCTRDELIDILNYCDLYIHSAEIESEAISCMEAFSCGLVPLINDSKFSATKQFALDKQLLTFTHDDPQSLADKMDYLIEHPEILAEFKHRYIEYAGKYRIEGCVTELENMLIDEVNDHRQKQAAQKGTEVSLIPHTKSRTENNE